MITAAPIAAMVWEQWRLTRAEAAVRLSLGIVGGSAALALSPAGATIAFWTLIVANAFFWFSISKLNGGKFSDGYKPGFPLYLLYSRPVSTVTIVCVAMVYDAISCTALYLVSAALLMFAFGQSLPLLSMALFLVSYHLACTCIQWATRSRVVQWGASIVVGWPMFFLLRNEATAPAQLDFSRGANALMIVLCIVSIGLAVAGVARQRRGDSVAATPQPKGTSSGYPDWLVNLIRFTCPTTSATKAQLWFELRSSGLPVLMIGLVAALLILLLCASGRYFSGSRPFAIFVAAMSLLAMLFSLGANAFGIRQRQGRRFANTFELTRPVGTAQLAGLKLLVRSACVGLALLVVGTSVWVSSSFLSGWGSFLPDGKNDALPGLLQARDRFWNLFAGLTADSLAALAILATITIMVVVAWQATREAIRVRNPRVLRVAGALLLLWCLANILLALAVAGGMAPASLARATFLGTFWAAGAAMAIATIYLVWKGFTDRALTLSYVSGALVIAAVFWAVWRVGFPATGPIGSSWLALLVLTIGLLAPWSFNRIRHT